MNATELWMWSQWERGHITISQYPICQSNHISSLKHHGNRFHVWLLEASKELVGCIKPFKKFSYGKNTAAAAADTAL